MELGGQFYLAQPKTSETWQLADTSTQQLIKEYSEYCVRDQCFDGQVHSRTGGPMQKSTRIQSNDLEFVKEFGQSCIGHNGIPRTGDMYGTTNNNTSFYPKGFCRRVISLWKQRDRKTPNNFIDRLSKTNGLTNFQCE